MVDQCKYEKSGLGVEMPAVMAVKPEISYNFLYASSNPSNFYCEALKI
jgi:hypothetical protein